MTSPVVRRGRPYRPPEDQAPAHVPVPDAFPRLAWLLGTSRILLLDGAYAHRRPFVERLHEIGISCDETRVSRWESGVGSIQARTIAAYETVLGLPPRRFSAVAEVLIAVGDHPVQADLTSEQELEELEGLLTDAFDNRCSGPDWVHLARLICRAETIFLRQGEWTHLAQRLTEEYCRSAHVAALHRLLAIRELLTHPTAQRHILRAIGEAVLDPRIDRGPGLIRLLGNVGGTEAGSLLVRLLASGDERVRSEACFALASSIVDGVMESSLAEQLVEPLVGLLRSPLAADAADVASRLPPALLQRIQARTDSPLLGRVTSTAEVVESTVARETVRTLTDLANPAAVQSQVEGDAMLGRLLRDALFNAHSRRRLNAIAVLAASAYSDRIAAGLVGLARHPDPLVSRRSLEALGHLAEVAHVPALAALITEPGPPVLRADALRALAQVPGPLPAAGAAAVVQALEDPSTAVANAAMYAAGMHALVAGRTVHPGQQAIAAWWLEHGSQIID